MRLSALFAVLSLCLLLSSCGSSNHTSSSPGGSTNPTAYKNSYLYVTEVGSGQNAASSGGILEVFAIDEQTGNPKPISGSPFSLGGTSNALVLTPNNHFAYIAMSNGGYCDQSACNLMVFSIDAASGQPTLAQTTTTQGDWLAMHPSGHFLYAATSGIEWYSVANDGSLSYAGAAGANSSQDSIVISPDGKYLYSDKDVGPNGNWEQTEPCGPILTNVYGYSINPSTGALTPISGGPFAFQRNECIVGRANYNLLKSVNPSSSRLLMVDEGNNDLITFSIDPSSGALSRLPKTTSTGFSAIVFDSNSDNLYVGSVGRIFGEDTSAATTTGAYASLPNLPMSVPSAIANGQTGSTAMAVDYTGTFLFTNQNYFTSAFSMGGMNDGLDAFRINSDGSLTQLKINPDTLSGTASSMVVATPQ